MFPVSTKYWSPWEPCGNLQWGFLPSSGKKKLQDIPVVVLVAVARSASSNRTLSQDPPATSKPGNSSAGGWLVLNILAQLLSSFSCIPGNSCVPLPWHSQSNMGTAWETTLMQAGGHRVFGFVLCSYFCIGDERACLKWFHLTPAIEWNTTHLAMYPTLYNLSSISLQRQRICKCTFEKQEIKILLVDLFYTNDKW